MAFGASDGSTALPRGRVAGYLLGVAVLAASLTLLFLSMRAVLDIGGACASGGPYVPSVECPEAVIAFTPLSILSGLAGIALMLWGGSAIPGPWVGLVFLAWPALFLSLGWNFLQYGFFPPGGAEGWVWSWIFCGVLFVLMGGVPLAGAVGAIRDATDGTRAYAGGRVVVRPRPVVPQRPRSAAPAPLGSPPGPRPPGPRPPGSSPAPGSPTSPPLGAGRDPIEGDVVDRLERLAALRRAGDITNDEYERAKAAILATDGGGVG